MEPLLEGVKVVELAEWAFVPSAAGVLCDWGASVVKVEHPRGDPLRGLITARISSTNYMIEQYNRGKRDIGVDIKHAAGREVFLKLIEGADVFVTSFLPEARRNLKITPEDLHAINPRLVYARGHGQGTRGPDAEKAGFDAVAFWARGGVGHMLTPPGSPFIFQRGAFGDSISGMFLAGGIAAALYRRSVTGKGGVVDVSLFSAAMWVLAPDILASALLGGDPRTHTSAGGLLNPLVGVYPTSDGRFVNLTMLQSDRYWEPFCRAMSRDDLLQDPRFTDFQTRAENNATLLEIVQKEMASRTLADWAQRLTREDCVWAPVATPEEVLHDVQALENGYVQPHPDPQKGRLVHSPVQYNEGIVEFHQGAPELGQHTEEVLQELGYDWDAIGKLKETGAIT